eukprot:gene5423-biopygen23713
MRRRRRRYREKWGMDKISPSGEGRRGYSQTPCINEAVVVHTKNASGSPAAAIPGGAHASQRSLWGVGGQAARRGVAGGGESRRTLPGLTQGCEQKCLFPSRGIQAKKHLETSARSKFEGKHIFSERKESYPLDGDAQEGPIPSAPERLMYGALPRQGADDREPRRGGRRLAFRSHGGPYTHLQRFNSAGVAAGRRRSAFLVTAHDTLQPVQRAVAQGVRCHRLADRGQRCEEPRLAAAGVCGGGGGCVWRVVVSGSACYAAWRAAASATANR